MKKRKKMKREERFFSYSSNFKQSHVPFLQHECVQMLECELLFEKNLVFLSKKKKETYSTSKSKYFSHLFHFLTTITTATTATTAAATVGD